MTKGILELLKKSVTLLSYLNPDTSFIKSILYFITAFITADFLVSTEIKELFDLLLIKSITGIIL